MWRFFVAGALLALITSSVWAQNRNSPYNDTFGAIQLQALVGGPSGVGPPSVVVAGPSRLQMVDATNYVLETNASSKICLNGFCNNYAVACSGGADISTPLTTAIASATNSGDQVSIGAGSCSMSPITITNKSITIQGAGQGITNITATGGFGSWNSTGSFNPTWRLSGMSLLSGGASPGIPFQSYNNQAAMFHGPIRIDHVDWNYPTSGNNLHFNGPIIGLIDHNTFTGNIESAIAFGGELNNPPEDGSTPATAFGAWLAGQPYAPGSAQNMFIENNTFTGNGSGIAAVDTGQGSGTRVVFRYNTLVGAAMYMHPTLNGDINSGWQEVYNNTATWTLGSGAPVFIRWQGGGTGLIYNNTISGYSPNSIQIGEQRLSGGGSSVFNCDGTHNWDGNAGDLSAPGWPCLVQTGRNADQTIANIEAGTKESSFPLYLWNNGPQSKCSNPSAGGAACDNTFGVVADGVYFKNTAHTVTGGGYGQGDVDYCINMSQPSGCGNHTLVYTPYRYPHPLTTP